MKDKREILSIEEIDSLLNTLSSDDKNFLFRYLEKDDYNKDYFTLLNFLTNSPCPRKEEWEERYESIKYNSIYIFVIEDIRNSKIVGNVSCLIENKFIRNLGRVSHIEDVIVLPECRNKKLGSKLIKLAIEFSQKIGCYKVILDSRNDAIGFYEKFGFEKKSEGMALYF